MDDPRGNKSVFVISSNYPRYHGDICGWFIHEISRQVTNKGYHVTALSPHTEKSNTHEVIDGVKIHRFRYCLPPRFEKVAYGSGVLYNIRQYPFAILTIPFFIIAEFLSACRIVRRKRPAIIHTHWLVPQGLVGAVLSRLSGVPHIATIHGSDLNILKKYTLLYPVARFITRNSACITVNSSYMKCNLLAVSPDCEKKIRVIPMGIDPAQFDTGSFIDMKQRHGAGHIILSVGRLIDWKGTKFLMEAMPTVLKKFPDAKLLIAGAGPEQNTLMRQACELMISDRVEFLSIVPATNLPSYYRSADVFVLPSINCAGKTEGLGVVLLEAMASGCPVIGSNVGGIPDIITDGENGFLVPEQDPAMLAEKIIRIISDADLREKFRRNGYVRVRESFTWEIISKEFLNIYSDTSGSHENNPFQK